jgi:hypothetical protein
VDHARQILQRVYTANTAHTLYGKEHPGVVAGGGGEGVSGLPAKGGKEEEEGASGRCSARVMTRVRQQVHIMSEIMLEPVALNL